MVKTTREVRIEIEIIFSFKFLKSKNLLRLKQYRSISLIIK